MQQQFFRSNDAKNHIFNLAQMKDQRISITFYQK